MPGTDLSNDPLAVRLNLFRLQAMSDTAGDPAVFFWKKWSRFMAYRNASIVLPPDLVAAIQTEMTLQMAGSAPSTTLIGAVPYITISRT